MYWYAQIDQNNIVVAVSRLKAPVNYPHMIPLEEHRDILGWRYDRETGEFVKADQQEASGE